MYPKHFVMLTMVCFSFTQLPLQAHYLNGYQLSPREFPSHLWSQQSFAGPRLGIFLRNHGICGPSQELYASRWGLFHGASDWPWLLMLNRLLLVLHLQHWCLQILREPRAWLQPEWGLLAVVATSSFVQEEWATSRKERGMCSNGTTYSKLTRNPDTLT